MKKNKITAVITILVIVTIILFCFYEEVISLDYLGQYKDTMNVTSIGHITNSRANEVLNTNAHSNDKLKMCFISNAGECALKSISIDKVVNAEVIYVNGYINLLFPELKYEKDIDNGSCIIDMVTASKLYGHTDIIGMKLTVANNNFVINDVIDSKQQFIIISDKENRTLQYDQLCVNTDGKSSKLILNKLSVVYGIQGKIVCFRIIGFLPLCLLAVMLIISSVLLILKIRNIRLRFLSSKYRYWFYGTEFLIIIFVIVLMLIFIGEMCPVDLIPTLWSAFDEWDEIMESINSSFKVLFIKNMLFFEYSYVLQLFKSIAFAFITYILFLIFKNCIYKKVIYIFDLKL
ncbi:MAG: hypothetical protein J1E85_03505 [Ruminococcus sp.]|nr:hypothetical protein [Ruminococcus sp.]